MADASLRGRARYRAPRIVRHPIRFARSLWRRFPAAVVFAAAGVVITAMVAYVVAHEFSPDVGSAGSPASEITSRPFEFVMPDIRWPSTHALLGSTCFKAQPSMVGTGHDDTLRGVAHSGNVITGGQGRDTLFGGLSADLLCAISGSDRGIMGGEGRDGLAGGSGDDGPIDGGGSADYLEGGAGNDVLIGGDGGDIVRAGDGDDLLLNATDEERDELHAEGGDDTVTGPSGGSDLIHGGEGDDILHATEWRENLGADKVDGGPGSDTCYVEANDTVLNCETVNTV